MSDKEFINIEKRGMIKVGIARMALFPISDLNALYDKLVELIGPVANKAFYLAGVEGATTFGNPMFDRDILQKNESGYNAAVEAYSQAGFGNFYVKEFNFDEGTAFVSGTETFEASDGQRQIVAQIRSNGHCNHSRGVFAAFMRLVTNRKDMECVEVKCEALGDATCDFKIAPRKVLEREDFIF